MWHSADHHHKFYKEEVCLNEKIASMAFCSVKSMTDSRKKIL